MFQKDVFRKEVKNKMLVEKEITIEEAAKEIGIIPSDLESILEGNVNGFVSDAEIVGKIIDWLDMPANLFFNKPGLRQDGPEF